MSPHGPQANAAAPRPWKGLDTSQMPVFIGYDQVERMVAALLDTAAPGIRTRWSASPAAAWCRRRWRPASSRCLCPLSATTPPPER